MSIQIECLNVVIQKKTIETKYPGGLSRYKADCPNQTFLEDEYLTRVGFMNPLDVSDFINRLLNLGFKFLDDQERCVDMVVVDMMTGPTAECDWLEFNSTEAVPHCWLYGTSPGQMSKPKHHGVENQTFFFIPDDLMSNEPSINEIEITKNNLEDALKEHGSNSLLLNKTQEYIDSVVKEGCWKLEDLLEHPYWLVRSMACEALEDADYISSSSKLIKLFKDENESVRLRAKEAIMSIHKKEFTEEEFEKMYQSIHESSQIENNFQNKTPEAKPWWKFW